MKDWERKIVPAGLLLAGLLFLIASVRPVLANGPINVAFLLIGAVCVVAGGLLWRRSVGGTST